ncbi:MAG: hypothetical protein WD334_06620 [Chitinophagales bacterium]
MMYRIFVFFLILFVLQSCGKEPDDNENPKGEIPETPYIELQDFNPKSIQQFDSVVFTIFYQDGDGDLGFQSGDSLSLWITDERFPLEQGFHIPPLSPVDTAISIQGTFQVTLKNVILENQSVSEEKATFAIKIKDRVGNWSNEVESGELTIKK